MPYPLVVPLLEGPALVEREQLVREAMPAEVTHVVLGTPRASSTRSIPSVDPGSAARPPAVGSVSSTRTPIRSVRSPPRVRGQEGHWTLVATDPNHLQVHVEDDRASLYNRAPFHHEPREAVIDWEELATRFVGRPYTVAWHCSEPVSVGCGPLRQRAGHPRAA